MAIVLSHVVGLWLVLDTIARPVPLHHSDSSEAVAPNYPRIRGIASDYSADNVATPFNLMAKKFWGGGTTKVAPDNADNSHH